MQAKRSDVPVRVGYPVYAHTVRGDTVLGIAVAIDATMNFDNEPIRVEEVSVLPLAIKEDGRDYFKPHGGDVVKYEMSEVVSA